MTQIYWHKAALSHETPHGHPEQIARAERIVAALQDVDGLNWREAPVADREEILRCHPEAHVSAIETGAPIEGLKQIDGDTFMSPGSVEAAYRAVGGCCAAVDAVVAGECKTAFVAMRPPGHHAEQETAMGFCLFGNAAIAAKRALEVHGLSRVAVLDFDVHHGNGTQALLWDEAKALFVSSHQSPLWPGTGDRRERGAHDNVLNVPLPPMSGGDEARAAWENIVFPRVDAFAPELIIISAGFDAHADDPLANLNWRDEDFTWLTREICRLAAKHADGRVVSTLEGGYDLDALTRSAVAHVETLKEHENG